LWNRSREALEVLPIVDSVPSRSVPVVTRALILINVIVFFIELSLPREMLEQAILYPDVRLGAAVTHVVTQPESAIPTVGASGAIAGVLGAYLLLFPTAKISA
jgi:membrane associated rhomboid family serine protease